MHTYTQPALIYTLPALYLHLHHCYVSQHREVEKVIGATEKSTSLYTQRPGTTVNSTTPGRADKHIVQAGVYTKTTITYTPENNDYQRITSKSARCRQNHQTNI